MSTIEETIRRVIREEFDAHGTAGRLAFTIEEAAAQVGYSDEVLRLAARRGELRLSYANTKPVITAAALREWLDGLPSEPWRR